MTEYLVEKSNHNYNMQTVFKLKIIIMKKYIILTLMLFITIWFSCGECITIVPTSGPYAGITYPYCWPNECVDEYTALGNDPQNQELKNNYRDCIGTYWPNNVWWVACTEDANCWIDVQCNLKEWICCDLWKYYNSVSELCEIIEIECAVNRKYISNWIQLCCDTDLMAWVCPINNAWNMWIEMGPDCLINWQCKFNIYETLWIRQSLPEETRSSPWIFIQDIILSATFFVGTLITWVLIVSWLLYVFSWAKPELASKAKKWITGSLIWLLFVVWSYAFVRLIQFLVTWWWG